MLTAAGKPVTLTGINALLSAFPVPLAGTSFAPKKPFYAGVTTGRAALQEWRNTYWLNPERTALWSTGDSEAHAYADVVEMHECRNVHQLTRLVTRLLPA